MSNAGQAALTIVGTVVGAYFGAPQLGYAVGSLAGQALFPTIIGAPKLTDNVISSSTEGAPIPLLYGTKRTAGLLMWATPVKRNAQGGKGGPQQQSYTDTLNAAYSFGEGPMVGVRKIWIDRKLVYDISDTASDESIAASGAFAEHFTFYPGSDTQLPDPTMESFIGAGNVPASRGLCYIVVHDLDVTKNGSRAPNIEAEIVQFGTMTSTPQLEYKRYQPWITGVSDPRSGLGVFTYKPYKLQSSGGGYTQNFQSLTAYSTLADALAVPGVSATGPLQYGHDLAVGFSLPETSSQTVQQLIGSSESTLQNHVALDIHYNWKLPTLGYYVDSSTMPDYTVQPIGSSWWVGNYGGLGGGLIITVIPGAGPSGHDIQLSHDVIVRAIRQLQCPPATVCDFPITGSTDFCIVGGAIVPKLTWSTVTGSYVQLQDYVYANISLADNLVITQQAIGPVIESSDPLNASSYWAGVASGSGVSGTELFPPINSGYDGNLPLYWPDNVSTACYATSRPTLLPIPTTVGAICQAIAQRAGLQATEIDFTAFTKVVWGYGVGRLSSGREMMTPLLQYQFGDVIEDGAKLIGVVRGGASVVTVTEDDLAAREAGGATPPRITVQRTQPAELPRQVRVHYLDLDNDYQAGMQSSAREYGQTRNPVDIELAIAMSASDAAACADVYLNEAFANRESYPSFTLPATDAFIGIKPSDSITLPIEGRSVLARVLTRDYQFPGLLTFTAVRSDTNVYTSNAQGTPATGSQNILTYPGPTSILYLDLPALQVSDNDAGAYIGFKAPLAGWTGAGAYRSVDGGASYTLQASGTHKAPYGTIASALPSASAAVYDTRNVINVRMVTGTLSSISYAQMSGSSNYAAIGADGRWEIIQYRDAVLQMDGSYNVAFLARGQFGSEAFIGSSVAGDTFVPLGMPLQRLIDDDSAIGLSRILKGVTYGDTLADSLALNYTVAGLALKPYAPCRLGGGRNAAGDILLQWTRRGRLNNFLRGSVEVPLSEDSEQYVVEILSGSAVVRTITVSGATSTSYTAAQQTADFGSTQSSLTFRVAQLSAQFGRGYNATGTA